MYTSFFIAKNNLKKKKSDVIVIALLIMLSTMLLYISASVLENGEKVVENVAEKCNTADHTYLTGQDGEILINEVWDDMEEVKSYETSSVLYVPGAQYGNEFTENMEEFSFWISPIEEHRNINKMYVRDGIENQIKENSIVLPYSLSVNEGYKVGEKFCMEIAGNQYEFIIAGFSEDPVFSTALNISIYRCYMPDEIISEIADKNEIGKSMVYSECRAVLKDGTDINEYSGRFVEKMAGRDSDNIIGMLGETMKGGVMMMPGILMGITLVFSVVLIAIAIIIMRFSVKNFVEDNLKNIGILQACGYTSSQLRRATVLEMSLVGAVGCIFGLMLSIFGQGLVGSIQASMMGLRYSAGFDWRYGIITFAIILAIVVGIAFFNSRAYKKIKVLDALRGGIHTHNFKKNVVPLHKTVLPLNTAIGAKNIVGAKFKNFSILLIVAILSFASCAGFALYENFALDRTFMYKMVGSELGTAITSGEDPDAMGREIETWDCVEKVGYYACIDVTVSSGDKSKTVTCDGWKNPKDVENIMVIEGQLPEYDNEVIISTVVRDYLGVDVGDVIYLQSDNDRVEFMVSGIHQLIANTGQKVMLNYEGIKRLNSSDTVNTLQIYIYANEGYGYEDIKTEIDNHYPGNQAAESEKMAEEAMGIVAMTMEMLCVLFVGMTVVVVFLVVFLVIRSKVVSEKKNNGIYKAIGYTTKNLMIQTTMSNLPVIFTGAVAGAVLSLFGVSPLTRICLSFCGIEKCDMVISPVYFIGTIIGITMLAAVVALGVSYRIRKVEPVKMLTEE